MDSNLGFWSNQKPIFSSTGRAGSGVGLISNFEPGVTANKAQMKFDSVIRNFYF
jgi:hypothetical protein